MATLSSINRNLSTAANFFMVPIRNALIAAANDIDALFTLTSNIVQTTQTASYTLVLSDAASLIDMNSASAVNVTVPPNSAVAFDIGAVIEICQFGAGQVTIVAGAGVTIRTPSSLTTRAQYSTVSLRKRATDEWVVSGDVT